jgi:hypothetical protein
VTAGSADEAADEVAASLRVAEAWGHVEEASIAPALGLCDRVLAMLGASRIEHRSRCRCRIRRAAAASATATATAPASTSASAAVAVAAFVAARRSAAATVL